MALWGAGKGEGTTPGNMGNLEEHFFLFFQHFELKFTKARVKIMTKTLQIYIGLLIGQTPTLKFSCT